MFGRKVVLRAVSACSSAIIKQKKVFVNARFASSLISELDASVSTLPMREAVRYTAGNVKVEAQSMLHYIDSQANAFYDYGFVEGDTIALWMAESMEKHVSLMAAAKLGLQVVDFDTSIIDVATLRDALKLSKCKSIIFDPITSDCDRLQLLRKSIPEFFYYDDSDGQPFHSKYYPELKYFIQTGFDIEMGCLNYKHCFLPDPITNYSNDIASKLADKTPLYSKIALSADGKSVTQSKVLTHGDILKTNDNTWEFAKQLVNKQYFEL